MRDVTERIFKGAISVFIKKGLHGTTQEVAKEANVAEVTLYRRFSTKENMFVTVIKNVLEKRFNAHVLKIAKEKDTEVFLINIIENRLAVLSKNKDLVKMLLAESLSGNLNDQINIPEIIFQSLKQGLKAHFELQNPTVDIDFCARQLGGIFLSHLVLPTDEQYNQLTEKEKRNISKKHAKSIMAIM